MPVLSACKKALSNDNSRPRLSTVLLVVCCFFENSQDDSGWLRIIDILAYLKEGDSYGAKQGQAPV